MDAPVITARPRSLPSLDDPPKVVSRGSMTSRGSIGSRRSVGSFDTTPISRGTHESTPIVSDASLDSNESPHQDVIPQAIRRGSGKSRRGTGGKTTKLRASDRTFVVKGFTAQDDKEDRDEPLYLDEVSQILLEGIHQDDKPKAMLKVLGRFADLCSQSDEHREQACQMGSPAAIVNLMRKWIIHKNVEAACFRVLIALTVGDEAARVRKTLWMVGGMEQILHVMGTFPDSRSIQFFGCNALLSLLPSAVEEENDKVKKWMGRRFVREHKGVKAVISAMIQFEEDRGVQEAGCSVLLKLATFMHSGPDRKLLLESGAVSAFSVALESHANDEGIQHFTTLFMNFMSGDL